MEEAGKKGKIGIQGSGSKVFQPHESLSFHSRCRSREKREWRAINKNPYRELYSPEGCTSVHICVSHGKCTAWGSLKYFYIFWKYRYFAFDRLCFWHWYFGRDNLNLISFGSIKLNCYIHDFACVTYYLNMQLLNMHFEYHNF